MSKSTPPRTPARVLDQFYTRPLVATACTLALVKTLAAAGTSPEDCLFVEPSAGAGAFLEPLDGLARLAMDIEPRHGEVVQADFLATGASMVAAARKNRPVVVLGNPPFGKNASLALRFINHAASMADWVAFILPRTFEKPLFQDRVDAALHLEASVPLARDSFLHAGQPYSVPVVFQIWRRKETRRQPRPAPPLSHRDFDFVATPDRADFAFQRVGAAAGKVSREGLRKSWRSHYFIKPSKACGRDVGAVLASIDWSAVKHRTAGNPSIGKRELVAAYTQAIQKAS